MMTGSDRERILERAADELRERERTIHNLIAENRRLQAELRELRDQLAPAVPA